MSDSHLDAQPIPGGMLVRFTDRKLREATPGPLAEELAALVRRGDGPLYLQLTAGEPLWDVLLGRRRTVPTAGRSVGPEPAFGGQALLRARPGWSADGLERLRIEAV